MTINGHCVIFGWLKWRWAFGILNPSTQGRFFNYWLKSGQLMKSEVIKKGIERAPHRSLLRALGVTPDQMDRPFIGIVNSFTEVVPGHVHLREIAEAVKAGVYSGGGVPFEFNTIAVCDGIAMNHQGMKYSLPSRDLIADSVEIIAQAHAVDALVFIPN